MKEGAGLLADSDVVVAVVEKFLGARNPGSAWGIDNQFEFEINVERAD